MLFPPPAVPAPATIVPAGPGGQEQDNPQPGDAAGEAPDASPGETAAPELQTAPSTAAGAREGSDPAD
jgi:hypothetical protein